MVATLEVSKRKSDKPPIRPKPAYLRLWLGSVSGGGRKVREGPWARRVRLALASDLVQGRCRAAETAISIINDQFILVNVAIMMPWF